MSDKRYDYLIVGAGLYGASFARIMTDLGKRCLVIDRRAHIAGNIYSKEIEGIQVHMYGPHIFHTDNEAVWKFVNRFARFNHFRYEPLANYCGQLYNLPFNMNTFHCMWGINTPKEALAILKEQRREVLGKPENLEEQAIKLVGRDIYEKLIMGYTKKQWGRECRELPASIIRRLPIRLRYDNNYFEHPFQGIPKGGYTQMVEKMLKGISVELELNFLYNHERLKNIARKIIYTGPIDEYFHYCYGPLEYRSLEFETEIIDCENYQGVAGMNFTDDIVPYTRIVEHKWFEFAKFGGNKTVITREYPKDWKIGKEPYYPINDDKNQRMLEKYQTLAKSEENIIFGGRLSEYKYYDMDQTVKSAMDMAQKLK